MITMAQTPRKAKFKTSVPLPTYDELERPDPNFIGPVAPPMRLLLMGLDAQQKREAAASIEAQTNQVEVNV